MLPDFEPKILAFACNWCSYAGADLAGVSRIQYPPNMSIIRVMCSGRVDPIFILDALKKGVDGVMVLGCHPGDCHYISGNLMAERKMRWTKELIEKAGCDPRRLKLEWISASEGERFANTAREFTEQIKELGPLQKEDKEKISAELKAASKVVDESRVRVLMGKERELVEEGNVYGDKAAQKDFDALMKGILDDEHTREKILLAAKAEPLSIKEISKRMGMPSQEIGRHVMWLRHKGKIALHGIEGRSPLYKTVEVEV
ncbi:MAG: hydrogenase iron-sulfur subunit [Methanomassiliicoccales archaeon]|nr:MAG: hydrogenase iron-sulfur subunit [Methanomassiliicoccales archaeon]